MPDITAGGNIKTDATHTVTLTQSNTDYSHAVNYCFNGSSNITVDMQHQQFTARGKDLQPATASAKAPQKEL